MTLQNKDKKNIRHKYVQYVSQHMLAMLGVSLYILADTFFIAEKMGAKGLAALNLALPIFGVMFGLGIMIAIGSATKFTILTAMGEKEKANQYFTQGFFTTIFIALSICAIGQLSTPYISRLLGAEADTVAYTTEYLKVVMSFAPMFSLNYYFINYVRNDGNPRLAMIASLTGSFANIVFDYLFVFPMGLGMRGAALATGMSPVLGLIILSFHFWKHKNTFHFTRMHVQISILAETFRLGFSSFFNEISSGVVIYVFNRIILGLTGTVGIAAYGIVANIAIIITSLFSGVGQGIQPLVSYYHGRRESKESGLVYRYAIFTSLFLFLISYLVIVLFRGQLVEIFNDENNQKLRMIAEKGMILYFIGFLPAGFNVVTSFYLTSSEKAWEGLLISISRGLVFMVGFAFLLSALFGMTGVWLSFPFAEFATLILSVLILYKCLSNKKMRKVDKSR